MSNQLKMADQTGILTLWRGGWPQRRIARELGVDRETVSRYIRLASAEANPANSTLGAGPSNPAISTPGNPGRQSLCQPLAEQIVGKLEQGLTAKRIWQDLAAEHGFAGGYQSVKRFVRAMGASTPLPFRRMECPPGQEAQVDFGRGALVHGEDGRRRWPHVFRIVLSHSRKAYSEAVWQQTTESFLRCLENAFWHFGGVPRTLVIDNLRAAVTKADWYDPELNPKLELFARHYGTVFLPTRPYTPRHKGKVESAIKYVRDNALKGRVFKSLAEQNRHLLAWEQQVADHRIHGTTRQQVGQAFTQSERAALQPLPPGHFPSFQEGRRAVHRDGHVEVDKAYYSVPPEYVTRQVWVRWDSRLVRVFNHRFEQIAVHLRREPGSFSTDHKHIAAEKISGVERGAPDLLRRARLIGDQAAGWAAAVLQNRGVQGIRTLQGLLTMTGRYSAEQIDRACQLALGHGAFRLQTIRELVHRQSEQTQFEFIQEHPLIRPMADYGQWVKLSP